MVDERVAVQTPFYSGGRRLLQAGGPAQRPYAARGRGWMAAGKQTSKETASRSEGNNLKPNRLLVGINRHAQ